MVDLRADLVVKSASRKTARQEAESFQMVLGGSWSSLFLACAVLSLLDVGLVAIFGDSSALTTAHYFFIGVAMSAWVALFLASTFSLGFLLSRPLVNVMSRLSERWRFLLGGAGLGLVLGVIGVILIKPWDLPDDLYRLDLVVPIAGTACGVVLALWFRAVRKPLNFIGLALPGALCFILDVVVMPGLYDRFHNVAAFFAIIFLALPIWLARETLLPLKRIIIMLLFSLLAQGVMLAPLDAVRLVAQRNGTIQPKLLSWIHFSLDLDRDGFSALFGGGDCNDLDENVSPGQCEDPANGIDDNCNGLVDGGAPTVVRHLPREPREPLADIYFVLVDALRGDLGGLEINERDLPGIDRMARTSLVFRNGYTPYPGTYYAMTCMSQSRMWRDTGPGFSTIFELLRSSGYDIQLWLGEERNRLDGDDDELIGENRRTADPFSIPEGDKTSWSAAMIDEAIDELAGSTPESPPRFRWLHLLDTHSPHRRAEPNDRPIEGYQREVQFVSQQLERLLSALESTERGRQAVVIVAADHGEGFGEHGSSYHGSQLYEENTRIAFMVHLPNVPHLDITAPASLIDLLPTVAAYLGLESGRTWRGRNWLEAIENGETITGDQSFAPRVLSTVLPVDNWAGLGRPAAQMVHDGRYKLIYNIAFNTLELYDLREDRGETNNLTATHPEIVNRLRERLVQWQDRTSCRREL